MELHKIKGTSWYTMLGFVVLVLLGDIYIQCDMIYHNQKQAQQIEVLQRAVQSDTDETKRLHDQLMTSNSQNKALIEELKKQLQSSKDAQRKASAAF